RIVGGGSVFPVLAADHAAGTEHVGAKAQGLVVQPADVLGAQIDALSGDAAHTAGVARAAAQRPPVGDDHAVKAQRVAQVGHGGLVPLDIHGVGDAGAAAVGHDPFGASVDGSLPADHPVVEVLRHRAGSAKGGVAAAADPVLGAGGEAVFLQRRHF